MTNICYVTSCNTCLYIHGSVKMRLTVKGRESLWKEKIRLYYSYVELMENGRWVKHGRGCVVSIWYLPQGMPCKDLCGKDFEFFRSRSRII